MDIHKATCWRQTIFGRIQGFQRFACGGGAQIPANIQQRFFSLQKDVEKLTKNVEESRALELGVRSRLEKVMQPWRQNVTRVVKTQKFKVGEAVEEFQVDLMVYTRVYVYMCVYLHVYVCAVV